MTGISWTCQACHQEREDEWISVAHRKVRTPHCGILQLNGRYCNDRSGCLSLLDKIFDAWADLVSKSQGGDR